MRSSISISILICCSWITIGTEAWLATSLQQRLSSAPPPAPLPSTSRQILLPVGRRHHIGVSLSADDGNSQQYDQRSFAELLKRVQSSSKDSSSSLIDTAAAITQESCRLLGVKSIGVDYGLVRTGIAVTIGYDPQPRGILSDYHYNLTRLSLEVVRIAKAEQVSRVILGLPLHKNGTIAEQTNVTLVFATELAKQTLCELGPDVPVLMWDERYTSKEAAARVHSRDPNRFLQGTLDAEAACIILESYYNDGGKDAAPINLPDEVRQICIERFQRQQEGELARRQAFVDDTERKILQRKENIARAAKLEEEQRVIDGVSSKKKKKKKKR
jgi:putative Holliday junction resolvase